MFQMGRSGQSGPGVLRGQQGVWRNRGGVARSTAGEFAWDLMGSTQGPY